MGIESLLARLGANVIPASLQNTPETSSFAGVNSLKIKGVTPVTPDIDVKVTEIPLKINGVTPVTPVTPVLCKVEYVWCVSFSDGSRLEVHCTPACDREDMERTYPDATDIQPVMTKGGSHD